MKWKLIKGLRLCAFGLWNTAYADHIVLVYPMLRCVWSSSQYCPFCFSYYWLLCFSCSSDSGLYIRVCTGRRSCQTFTLSWADPDLPPWLFCMSQFIQVNIFTLIVNPCMFRVNSAVWKGKRDTETHKHTGLQAVGGEKEKYSGISSQLLPLLSRVWFRQLCNMFNLSFLCWWHPIIQLYFSP